MMFWVLAEWVLGLGGVVLLLGWSSIFPGLTDTSPEVDTGPGHDDAMPAERHRGVDSQG